MANIYDVAAGARQANVPAEIQAGIQTSRQNTLGNIAVQQAQQQQQDTQTLRGLAPGIVAGDPTAYAQAAAINPDQANNYQGAADQQLSKLRGAINYIDQQKTPEAKEAAYQNAVRPYLAAIGAAQGKVPPATFAEAAPMMEAARGQIASIPLKAATLTPGSVSIDQNSGRVIYNNQASDKIIKNATIGDNGQVGTIAVGPHGGTGNVVSLNNVPGTGAPGGMASADFYNAVNGIASDFGGTITSGVRDAQHNAEVGGVQNSQHLSGTAADVVIPADQKAAAIAKGKALGLQPIDEGDHIHFQNPNGGAGVSGVRMAVGTPQARANPSDHAPAGYRFTANHDLEAIPGGPADTKSNAQLSDNAIENGAWGQIFNNDSGIKGYGKEAGRMRALVANRVAEIAHDAGVSPQELATTAGRNKALQASQTNLQKQSDVLDKNEETFLNNANTMMDIGKKLDNQGPTAWNEFKNKIKNNALGDPDVAAWTAAVNTVANEYAKISTLSTGSAGATEGAMQHAREVINGGYNVPSMQSAIGVLRKDIDGQKKATEEKLQAIQEAKQKFGNSGEKPKQAAPSAATPAGQQDFSHLWSGG